MNAPSSTRTRLKYGLRAVLTIIIMIATTLLIIGLLWAGITGTPPFSGHESRLDLRDSRGQLDWAAIILRSIVVLFAIGCGAYILTLPRMVDLPGLWRSARRSVTVDEGFITQGTVISKNHTHQPEHWEIIIEGVDSTKQILRNRISVNKEYYDHITMGQQWPPDLPTQKSS